MAGYVSQPRSDQDFVYVFELQRHAYPVGSKFSELLKVAFVPKSSVYGRVPLLREKFAEFLDQYLPVVRGSQDRRRHGYIVSLR